MRSKSFPGLRIRAEIEQERGEMVLDMGAERRTLAVAPPKHRAVREHQVLRLDPETHLVLRAGQRAGYVCKVGAVYVALEGPDLPMACEVGQSLIWDVAVSMVERAHRSR